MTDATGGAAPPAANAAQTDTTTDAAAASQPLTLDTLGDALKRLLPSVMNSALTDHTKRIERKFEAKFAALTPAQAKAEAAADEAVVDAGAGDDGAAAGKPAQQGAPAGKVNAQPLPDPRLAAMERELAKLKRDAEKSAAQAAAERKQRLEDQGHEQIRAALRGKVHAGVEDDILDAWRARRAVVVGDDGSTRVRFGGQDEPEEGLDVQAAVAAFLKTDRAKHYIPAPANGAQRGAGARLPLMGRPAANGAADPAGVFEQKHGVPLGKAILGG